jgi:hypothetical protein
MTYDWNTGSGALYLSSGDSFESEIILMNGSEISSGLMVGSIEGSINVYLTNNGSDFQLATAGTSFNFNQIGSCVKWSASGADTGSITYLKIELG